MSSINLETTHPISGIISRIYGQFFLYIFSSPGHLVYTCTSSQLPVELTCQFMNAHNSFNNHMGSRDLASHCQEGNPKPKTVKR